MIFATRVGRTAATVVLGSSDVVLQAALATIAVSMSAADASEAPADFFVDFDGGNDDNLGTTQGAAWRTLPGTRTTSGGGGQAAFRSNWGDITTGNRVPAGSIIELRAGTSYTSVDGGRWYFFSDYYVPPTLGNETTIRVSSTWGAGNISINPSGMNSFDGTWELFSVRLSHFRILGKPGRVIRSTGNPGTCRSIFGTRGTQSTEITNVGWDYVEVDSSNVYIGMIWNWINGDGATNFVKNFRFTNIGVGAADGCGMMFGDEDDLRTRGILCEDGVVSTIATAGTINSGQISHGIQGTNSGSPSQPIIFNRVEVSNCGRDGFDVGFIGGRAYTATSNWVLTNCSSHDNQEDGIGCNNQAGGPGAGTVQMRAYNTTLYNNGNTGSQPYEGVWAYFYGCTFVGNGQSLLSYSEFYSEPVQIFLRNNYFESGTQFANAGINNFGVIFDSDYNVWRGSSLTNNAFVSALAGNNTAYDYNTWPEFGANDDRTTVQQGFVNRASGSFGSPAAGDYHLTAGGPCHDAGIQITNPTEAATDADGIARGNPPDCGAYEF